MYTQPFVRSRHRPTPTSGTSPPPTAIEPAPGGGPARATLYYNNRLEPKGSALANDQGPPSLTTGSGPE